MPVRAVVFDWGNTLMRVLPEYSGPMASWPRVEAVEGSAAVLGVLKQRYRLAVASNAGDSDAAAMAAALERVDLREFFAFFFTPVELGARKPAREFYQRLVAAMGVPAEEAVMVGDDYQADVAGARGAGLRAIWFRPGTPAVADDYTITALRDLPWILYCLEGDGPCEAGAGLGDRSRRP